jgi:hypothetical protein
MERFFIPSVLVIFFISTVIVAVAGESHFERYRNEKICVESRSCAINYINKLEKNDENQ